jgi:hypothetical protein
MLKCLFGKSRSTVAVWDAKDRNSSNRMSLVDYKEKAGLPIPFHSPNFKSIEISRFPITFLLRKFALVFRSNGTVHAASALHLPRANF